MAGYIGTNKLGNNGGRLYSFLNRPVLVDCSFTVAASDSAGLGITGLKGAGVQNVFMHTSGSAGIGNNGVLNPNPAAGIVLVQLANNYNRYAGGFNGVVSPLSGSNLAINGSALTVGNPYVITSVGHGPAGSQTITTVADTAGSLASTWFSIYDAYGNTYIVWFSVSGVGSAPVGVVGTLVQVQLATNDSNSTVASKLNTVLAGLLAAQPGNLTAPSGVNSFSTSPSSNVITVTNPVNQPFVGIAQDGAIATGFTFAVVNHNTNQQCWNGVGLPAGLVPALNQSFIAKATGVSSGGGSTGLVKAVGISGIDKMEVIGDPNASLAPAPMGGSPNVGGWVMVQTLAATSASVTTLLPTAPADGSVIYMSFYVEAGSILIAGE